MEVDLGQDSSGPAPLTRHHLLDDIRFFGCWEEWIGYGGIQSII